MFSDILADNLKSFNYRLGQAADVNQINGQGFTPLLTSLWLKRHEMTRILLEKEAQVNYCNEIFPTAWPTPLDVVIHLNDKVALKLLIKFKVDINRVGPFGWTPLHRAASLGHIDLVRRLISAGAHVAARTHGGSTALLMAAEHGHTAVLEVLLNNKADVNACNDNGTTALFRAIRNNHQDCVSCLIKYQVNLDYTDSAGWTAGLLAARRGVQLI